jgi:nicotinamide riboside kinase
VLGGRQPDVVLTGEGDYGAAWAAAMGCTHIGLDTRGGTCPSGAAPMLRAELRLHWDWLTPPAKAHFCRRVVVLGVESSGRTTLARALAAHFETAWVPEYGRAYREGRQHCRTDSDVDPATAVLGGGEASGWHTHELLAIARAQQRAEDDLAMCANRVLICDTDALATAVWHRRHVGCHSQLVQDVADERDYALYILTPPDYFPSKQDSTPSAGSSAVRHLCACIGSPCLRQCVHGAPIGGRGGGGALADARVVRRGPGDTRGAASGGLPLGHGGGHARAARQSSGGCHPATPPIPHAHTSIGARAAGVQVGWMVVGYGGRRCVNAVLSVCCMLNLHVCSTNNNIPPPVVHVARRIIGAGTKV